MTIYLLIVGLVLCLFYCALMGWIGFYLNRRQTSSTQKHSTKSLTLVIPFRNEAKNLPVLAQTLQATDANIILIDDHSTDNSLELANKHFPNAQIIQSEGIGKKAALLTGVKCATTSHLLMIDADICPPQTWIHHAVEYCLSSNQDLLLFPVVLRRTRGILQAFEAFDMLGLMTITKATANANKAILGNGAALSVSKEDYLLCHEELKSELASGDDVFLVHAMKKRGKSIEFASPTNLQVQIAATPNLRSFVGQRIRWGQKSTAYTDRFSSIFAWIVLLVSLWFIVALVSLFFTEGRPSTPLFMLLSLKLLTDVALAVKARKVFEYEIPSIALFFFALAYPFYILFVGICGFFIRPNWKGRKV